MKQWNEKVPPGWRPRSYPLKEYKNLLSLWAAGTSLTPEKIGPAMASRLDNAAFKVASDLEVVRFDQYGNQTTCSFGAWRTRSRI